MLRLLCLELLVSAAAAANWSDDIHALLPTQSQDPILSPTSFSGDAASKPFDNFITSVDAASWAVASSTVPLATSASRQQSVYPTAEPRRWTSLENSVSTTASFTSETSPAESVRETSLGVSSSLADAGKDSQWPDRCDEYLGLSQRFVQPCSRWCCFLSSSSLLIPFCDWLIR